MFEMNRCYYCTLHGVSVLSVHSQSTEWGALAGDVIVHFYWECEVHCHGRDALSSQPSLVGGGFGDTRCIISLCLGGRVPGRERERESNGMIIVKECSLAGHQPGKVNLCLAVPLVVA